MDKKTIIYKIICAVVVIGVAVLLLSGLLNKGVRTNSGPLTGEDVKHVTVKAPEETAYDGTIKADAWQAAFPEITLSMKANKDNAEIIPYLEQDPYLVSIYEGFGFAKEYGSARGHEYTLEDVHNTARPHATANCLTCKTPNFAKMVQDKGVSVLHLSRQRRRQRRRSAGNPHLREQGPDRRCAELYQPRHPVLRPVPHRILLHTHR